MAFEQQTLLIDRLVQKTSSNELDWKASVEDNTFQVSLKKNGVKLTKIESSGANNPAYIVALLDTRGEEVETFSDFDIDQEMFGRADSIYYKKLRDLFEMARRKVLGADKVLNDILKELE